MAAFQHSASGPEKLRAILQSPDRKGPLRAEAALRLLDLPRSDVDGRALLFSELHRLDAPGKRAILPAFKEGLSLRMQTRPGEAPSAQAILAKDAGARLLPMLEPVERALLGGELLRFMAEDVPRRADVGQLKLEQIAAKVGSDSAKVLIDALNDRSEARSLARILAIIDEHAEPAQRTRAALRIAELEKAYRARPDAQVSLDRELTAFVLPSLSRFADQPGARRRLLEVASTAAVALEQRKQALQLLEGRCTEDDVPGLLTLTQNESAPEELRVMAMSRVGETKSNKALPVFLILLTDRKHHALRRRAGELSLELGGTDAALSFFRNLPVGWGMKYDKAEIDAYSEQLAKLTPNFSFLLLLGNKLHSSFWWNRVMALRYFASRGTAEDVWRIRQHVHDILPIDAAGYPPEHTVGLEAETALAQALERLRAASARRKLGEAAQ